MNSSIPQGLTLRTVYTTQQFADEILGGNRSRQWVSDQCRAKKIKTTPAPIGSPFLIPQSEAVRFLNPR